MGYLTSPQAKLDFAGFPTGPGPAPGLRSEAIRDSGSRPRPRLGPAPAPCSPGPPPVGEPSRPAPLRAPAPGLQGWARAPRLGQEDGGERAGAETGAALQAGDRHSARHPAAAGPGGVELQRPGGGRAGRGALTAGQAGGQAGRGGARGPGRAKGSPGWGSGTWAACVPDSGSHWNWASDAWRPFPGGPEGLRTGWYVTRRPEG